MFRHISSPKNNHRLGNRDDQRQQIITSALPQLKGASLDSITQAQQANDRRLTSVAEDNPTFYRLSQRTADLQQIKTYFDAHSDVTFLGLAGWGDHCEFKLPSHRGFSQTDSVVYRRADGSIVIEKISSCLELFSSNPQNRPVSGQSYPVDINPFPPAAQTDDPPITSFGERSIILPSPPSQLQVSSRIRRPPILPPTDFSNLYCGTNIESLAINRPPVHRCVDPACTDTHLSRYWVTNQSTPRPGGLSNASSDDGTESEETTPLIQPDLHSGQLVQDNDPPSEETALLSNTDHHPTVVGNEGCACCMNAIDLDELAGIAKVASGAESPYGTPSTIDTHWAISTGLGGPFAALGLVASYRNITGAWATRAELRSVLNQMDAVPPTQRTPQWHAARETLAYSYFDTHWNLLVPGGLNGLSAASVLTGLAVSSPVALPALGLYGAAQAGRNTYDFIRNWRSMIGHEKIDQITRSKRWFYGANSTGFACVTAGAILTALSPITLGTTLIPGIVLLGYGTVSTGLLNNIWPKKFRPRNGDLGINRRDITLDLAQSRIQEIAREKKAIKDFRNAHMPVNGRTQSKLVAAKLMATLPWCDKLAQTRIHAIRTQHLDVHRAALIQNQNQLFDTINTYDRPIEALVTTRLKELRYQQYGLVDFYWALTGSLQNGDLLRYPST